jgi:hypothetical protein
MVNEFLFPELRRHDFEYVTVWFQQDGATAHTARQSINKLRTSMSEQGIITRYGDISWPDFSPACDFFSWGYLKNKVFQTHQIEVHNLKRRIYDENNAITQAVLTSRKGKCFEPSASMHQGHVTGVILEK